MPTFDSVPMMADVAGEPVVEGASLQDRDGL